MLFWKVRFDVQFRLRGWKCRSTSVLFAYETYGFSHGSALMVLSCLETSEMTLQQQLFRINLFVIAANQCELDKPMSQSNTVSIPQKSASN